MAILRTIVAVQCLALSSGMQSKVELHSVPSFDDYITIFGRSFARGSPEYSERQTIYDKRVAAIQSQNLIADASWSARVNRFTDRTDSELKSFHGWSHRSHSAGGLPSSINTARLIRERAPVVPEAVDWTKENNPMKKGLTALKVPMDQSSCGSCWAFATIAMVNSHFEIQTGTPKEFSPQELVDCVENNQDCGGTGGCDGATVELAMGYITNRSLSRFSSLLDYKYHAKDQVCQAKKDDSLHQEKDSETEITVGHWNTLDSNQALPLLQAVAHGPVAVSVAASSWFMYGDGIFGDCPLDAVINHAVLLVGYGTNYWKIQNSWGDFWGEGGYMRLQRRSPAAETALCGTDSKPEDGVACKPYPKSVTVCGMCGILYDSVAVHFVTRRKNHAALDSLFDAGNLDRKSKTLLRGK